MAMPASGCIGIITCPNNVACTSISQAVSGNVTPPKSLCALSVSAGKSAPHGMTEFYGYSSAIALYTSNIQCFQDIGIACSDDRICGIAASTCVGITICYQLGVFDAKAGACAYVYCNGSSIRNCNITTGTASGTFTVFTALSTDCVVLCSIARSLLPNLGASSALCMSSLTQCVGNYCIGSPNSSFSIVGAV